MAREYRSIRPVKGVILKKSWEYAELSDGVAWASELTRDTCYGDREGHDLYFVGCGSREHIENQRLFNPVQTTRIMVMLLWTLEVATDSYLGYLDGDIIHRPDNLCTSVAEFRVDP